MGNAASLTGDSWGEDDNPRRYDAYAREYPSYQETSRDLVSLALCRQTQAARSPDDRPETALPRGKDDAIDATVLDLACGTGATTREILAVLGPAGQVTGVDKSAAMLGVAASSVTDSRVAWIQSPAESVDRLAIDPVDAVICNSAIWQTDLAATASAVRAVLKSGGRFAFNVPVGFLADGDTQGLPERNPLLLAQMRAIAERDYGWTPPVGPPARVRPRLTRESIRSVLETASFDVELVREVSYHHSAESQRAWLSIPIFTKDPLRGLPYEDRLSVIDEAYERLGPGQTEHALWVIFVARPGVTGQRTG
ncbi:MAG TPA: methyltransferase domain-containing protein [Streptosporangiaceae bacterium]|nr:methyltransferase domain-containing protein [Streptosporangiaceae bacterium]